MLRRREFLGGVAAAALGGTVLKGDAPRVPKSHFGLNAIIEANPKAVFIRRTHVPHKMDAAAKLQEGHALAREIFVPLDGPPGVPVSDRVILKPNSTSLRQRGRRDVDLWGTGTDPQFYEGMVLGLKELGLTKFHFVEADNFPTWNVRGYMDINERLGIEMNEPERRPRHFRDGEGITWTKVPDGVVFTRIPHYAPVNEPGTWLLNIAKWKAHAMCLTQTVKNLQGLVADPYVSFCSGWPGVTGVPEFMKGDFNPRAEEVVKKSFERHRSMGYARYDSAIEMQHVIPIAQEIWAHKTCDHHTIIRSGLSMVEGIYSRDGDGFYAGKDYLTNLVFFGKDSFHVDLVGLYLGGHEPGNLALYRIAKERGLADTFNPWEVPVFEWENGRATPRKLTDFPRTPLAGYYLQKPNEPMFHLMNEPFDYDRIKA
jgi:uncharacterized protein (DUF362 family)